MAAQIIDLAKRRRARTQYDAAAAWLLSELPEPVTIVGLRALAEKELERPRDRMHRIWAKAFLRETKHYNR